MCVGQPSGLRTGREFGQLVGVAVSRYSDEERDNIMRTARELLDEQMDAERLDDYRAEDAFQADISSNYQSPRWIDELLGPEDPLERHRAEQEKLTAERAAYRQREAADTNTRRSRDWEKWADARVDAALAAHDKLWIEAVGGALAEERELWRAEFAQALAEYGARGDQTVAQLRQEIARTKAVDDGTLIDITPAASVVRKTKDNAA
jgi:hypothetical protein